MLVGAFDIGALLKNTTNTVQAWGGSIVVLLGVICILVAVYKIAKGFMSQQQTNWFTCIALLLFGGALVGGGYNFVVSVAKGGKQTIEDLGNGSGNGLGPNGLTILLYHLKSMF